MAAAPCQKPDVDAKHQEEIKKDVDLGKEYVTELEKSLKLSEDKVKLERVRRIGGEIAEIARTTHVNASWGDSRMSVFDYTFKVVDDKDVNAFSVPGGFIYINSGLLDDVESDDELAAVMAHEISHAAHRHLITLMREKNKIDMYSLPLLLAAILGKSKDAGNIVVTQQLLSTALTSGWSVKAELDADHTGFAFLLKSKYHPVALLTFMERLAFQERQGPNIDYGIQRTHPPSRERVNQILGLLKDNNLPVARSQVTTSYRATAVAADSGIDVKFGKLLLFKLKGDGASSRADEIVPRLNEFFDSSPQLFSVRTDGSRLLGNGKTLVEFATADGDPSTLAAEAQANVKKALFSLSYHTGN